MIISKVKSTYPVTLQEVKTHLRVDANNFDDDDYIENAVIPAATRFCENFITKDIALTTNTYTVYDFYSDCLRVDEGNLQSITDVSINGTLYTDYELKTYNDHFELEWDNYLGGDDYTLTTHFVTGYNENECPEEIRQAIFIACGDFYDVNRSSYTLGNIKREDVIQRLLMYHKSIVW